MELRTAICKYCDYQERSHQEVKDKLYDLGATTTQVNELMADLIESGLLNEERFACSFARGRFKLKHWGRVKITSHLRWHRISAYLIKKALKEIDPSEYFGTALRLGEKKWDTLKGSGKDDQRRAIVYRYLLQKGYEAQIITEVIREIQSLE